MTMGLPGVDAKGPGDRGETSGKGAGVVLDGQPVDEGSEYVMPEREPESAPSAAPAPIRQSPAPLSVPPAEAEDSAEVASDSVSAKNEGQAEPTSPSDRKWARIAEKEEKAVAQRDRTRQIMALGRAGTPEARSALLDLL